MGVELAEYQSLQSEVLVYLDRQERRLNTTTGAVVALLAVAVVVAEPTLAWFGAALAAVGWRGHGSLGDQMSRIATFVERKYGREWFSGRGWSGLYNADVNATRATGEGTDLGPGVSADASRDSVAKHVAKEVVSRTLPTLFVLSAAVGVWLGFEVGFTELQALAAAFATAHFWYAAYRQYGSERRRRSFIGKLDAYLARSADPSSGNP